MNVSSLALCAVVLIAGTAHATVVINNPGFEDPNHTRNDGTDPNDWAVIESGVGSQPARQVRTKNDLQRSGSMGLSLGAGQSNHDGELWQAVTTVASQPYTFSIWATALNDNNPAGQGFTVHLRDGTGTSGSILETVASSGDLPVSTFKEYAVDFTASSATTTIHILDSSTAGASDSNDVYLDDVSISAVPEPATLVFAVLGGLSMLLMRRRRG